MKKVSATNLRKDLFKLLGRIEKGESMSIILNGHEVAVIMPLKKDDWRAKLRDKPKMTVPADEAFLPIDDIWEDR